ncbi:TPA_asm: hypothetical protein [Altiarchaeum virus]|nr:TPA_asm: hypothetical protein [Altiarchaeum virus]
MGDKQKSVESVRLNKYRIEVYAQNLEGARVGANNGKIVEVEMETDYMEMANKLADELLEIKRKEILDAGGDDDFEKILEGVSDSAIQLADGYFIHGTYKDVIEALRAKYELQEYDEGGMFVDGVKTYVEIINILATSALANAINDMAVKKMNDVWELEYARRVAEDIECGCDETV